MLASFAYQNANHSMLKSVFEPVMRSMQIGLLTFSLLLTIVVAKGLEPLSTCACCSMVDRTIGARRIGCLKAAALKGAIRIAMEFILPFKWCVKVCLAL